MCELVDSWMQVAEQKAGEVTACAVTPTYTEPHIVGEAVLRKMDLKTKTR